MDWTVPDSPTSFSNSTDISSENAVAVVYCCWRAAERLQSENKVGEAILLLSKLNCSRFACISPLLEFGSRLRLAELCCNRCGLEELAIEQINRTWTLISSDNDDQSIELQLVALKYQDIAHRTRYESRKEQKDAQLCAQVISQALQICMAHQLKFPSFLTYFSIRKMDLSRLLGNSEDCISVVDEIMNSLVKFTSRRSFKSKAPSIKEAYNRKQLASIAALKIRKAICYLEKGETGSARQEIDQFDSETSSLVRNIPEIIEIRDVIEVSILFQEAHFFLALKSLEKMNPDSGFRNFIFSEILRYIGSIKPQKTIEPSILEDSYQGYIYQNRHLSEIESKFVIAIQTGNLRLSKRHLLDFRYYTFHYWPYSIPPQMRARYLAMNAVFGVACGKFEFALESFSAARKLAINIPDQLVLDHHILLTRRQIGVDMDSKRDIDVSNFDCVASPWFLAKSESLLDWDSRYSSIAIEEIEELNKSIGSLNLAIWSKINHSAQSTSQAINLSKQVSYIEGEYHAYKRLMIRPDDSKFEPAEIKTEVWSKQRAVLASYRTEVDEALLNI